MKTFRFLSIMIFFSIGLFISCAGGSDSQTKPIPSAPNKVTYTVTYNGNGNISGTVPSDTALYETGQIVTVPGNTGSLAKTGFAFTGWNTLADGSGTTFTQGQTFAMGAVDVILYAKWTANPTYSITYNGNNNTTGSVPVDSTHYEQDQTVTVAGNSGNLMSTGFTFAGWNTQADGSGITYSQGQTFVMGSSNIILYAKWTTNPTYSVTYIGNSNTGGSVPMDSTNYEQSQTITIFSNTGNLVRTGYTFSGWNRQSDGNGTTYTQGQNISMGSANIVLYAKWAINQYSVSYNANGNDSGSVPESANYDYNATVTVSTNSGNLAKSSNNFAGWNTQADGYGTNYTAGSGTFTMPANSVILYAKWSAKPLFTVYFDSQGGSVVSSQQAVEGEHATSPDPAPTRSGYAFAGWFKESGCVSIWDFATDTVTEDITLYAKWNVAYTVTYDGNGNTSGSVPLDNNYYEANATVTVKSGNGFSRACYSFINWNTQADGNGSVYVAGTGTFSMPVNNVTLYAHWNMLTYVITYNLDGGTNAPLNPANYTIETGTIDFQNPTKAGYHFEGWYSDSVYMTQVTQIPQGSSGNKVLYTKWSPVYTVYYDGNGNNSGSAPTDPSNYAQGQTVTVLGNTGSLAKSNYLFTGWNTQADGLGTSYTGGQSLSMGNADVTLYAIWVIRPGSIDDSFVLEFGTNGSVTAITVQSDNSIFISGDFTSPYNRLCKYEPNGGIDYTFNVGYGLNGPAAIHILSDGKALISGDFSFYNSASVYKVARLDGTGALDTAFDPGTGPNGSYLASAVQSDGKVIISGKWFTSFNGTAVNGVARLDTNGSLDTSFNPGSGFNNSGDYPGVLAIQNDGKILVAGSFDTYNGTSINRIARLNNGGTLDISFNPGSGPNGGVSGLVIQSDGKIVIIGEFTSYNGTSVNRLARVNSDGSLDNTFNQGGSGLDSLPISIVIDGNDRILLSGYFTSYNETTRNKLLRLNSDGSLDASLDPGTGPSGIIAAIGFQSDGKILLGGRFTSYDGNSIANLVRINP